MKKKDRLLIYSLIVVGFVLVLSGSCKKDDDDNSNSITDIDGNVYTTVTIGTQVWMVENLKVTKYRNGDPIPNVTDATQWKNLTTGAYCNYDNVQSNIAIYGRLYNWYAVNDNRNIAPTGWHVATDAEWTTLTDYLGGSDVAGGKLKETDTVHWKNPNSNATNEHGFTALPGGYRGTDGIYYDLTEWGNWWSSTAYDGYQAWLRWLNYDDGIIGRGYYSEPSGISVRCVRD